MISTYLVTLLIGGLVSAKWQFASCFVPTTSASTLTSTVPRSFWGRFSIERESTKSDTGIPFTGALDTIPSLASLPLIPYIDEDGYITKLEGMDDSDNSRSSFVFAIFDDDEEVQYIGATDHLHHMLKVMLARRPDKTYFYKAFHIAKPSRSMIDLVMDFWLAEGRVPPGNGEGEEEELWEKPLDVKPRFTDQDYADIEELEKQGHMSKDMAMKVVTWQFEEEKMELLRSRGVKEEMHFDLSLKGDGILDLKVEGHLEP